MFGYVQIYKDELKVKEYNVFRSYYCGLCKTLKDEYGFSSRMGLNYDSVFLALILSSVTNAEFFCQAERCIANPFRKKAVAQTNKCLSYSAGVMVILALLKLRDNMHDEHSIKSFFAYCCMRRAKRHVLKRYGGLYKKSEEFIFALSRLEADRCASIDQLSHEFASLMQLLFTPDFIEDQNTRRILGHMGYMLGRFIYILDAYEDMEKDKKKNCFNVFLLNPALPDKEELRASLTFTLSSVASSYELLTLKVNKSILDNIIYLGLSNVLDNVLDHKGEKKHERSI